MAVAEILPAQRERLAHRRLGIGQPPLARQRLSQGIESLREPLGAIRPLPVPIHGERDLAQMLCLAVLPKVDEHVSQDIARVGNEYAVWR